MEKIIKVNDYAIYSSVGHHRVKWGLVTPTTSCCYGTLWTILCKLYSVMIHFQTTTNFWPKSCTNDSLKSVQPFDCNGFLSLSVVLNGLEQQLVSCNSVLSQ